MRTRDTPWLHDFPGSGRSPSAPQLSRWRLDDAGREPVRRSRSRRIRRRRQPAGQGGQAAPAPDGQAQGDQATQPTFRAGHQPRARRRHRHRQEGRAGRHPEAGRLPGVRGRQAAGRRVVQAVQDRRDHLDDARAAHSHQLRRGVRGAASRTSGCSPSSWTTTTCAAATPCSRAASTGRLRPRRRSRRRTWSASCTRSQPTDTRRHEPRSREPGEGARAVRRAQVRLLAAKPVRGPVRELPGDGRRADPQRRVALGDQGADHQAGRPARGPQGAGPGERGLHELPAAADAAPERR